MKLSATNSMTLQLPNLIKIKSLYASLKQIVLLATLGCVSSAYVAAQVPATPETAAPETAPPQPIPAISPSDEIGRKIIHRSLYESVWGEPVMCDVSQTTELYQRRITGFGRYIRGGKGSGRLRMSLQIAAGDRMNSFVQISDGELLYSHILMGEREQRTRVDLGKIRERMSITRESLSDPVISMHLAVGGQAELIRKLCQQYQWTNVEEGELNGTPVWWLTGKLTFQLRPPHGQTEIDGRLRIENYSKLLPTETKLAIGTEKARIPFWLYQSTQSRIGDTVANSGTPTDLYVITDWSNPRWLGPNEVTADIFETPTTSDHFSEENKLYLPPLATTAQLETPVSILR